MASVEQFIARESKSTMQISVTSNRKTTVVELNDYLAAADLFAQLPLKLKVEDHSDNKKKSSTRAKS